MKNFIQLRKLYSLSTNFSAVVLLFIFNSILYAETPGDSLKKDSQKYLSFYETIDEGKIHWEVNFDGDKIISIYKNGKQIPDDLLDDYKDKVYSQLDEMRFGEKKFSFQMPRIVGDEFDFNFDELNKELEELKKNLPELKENFQFHHFDSEEFNEEMKELEKELDENKSKIYKFKWNDEEFKKQMEEFEKELKENLPKLKKFHFYYDSEEDFTEV